MQLYTGQAKTFCGSLILQELVHEIGANWDWLNGSKSCEVCGSKHKIRSSKLCSDSILSDFIHFPNDSL